MRGDGKREGDREKKCMRKLQINDTILNFECVKPNFEYYVENSELIMFDKIPMLKIHIL